MKSIDIGRSGLRAPAILAGCMRIGSMSVQQADAFIQTALECGITMFDHADIYGGGAVRSCSAKCWQLRPRCGTGC